MLKMFLLAYSFFFISQHLNPSWTNSLIKNVPIFELFGLFYDSLPQKVHTFILGLGVIVMVFTGFKIFRRLTSFLIKLLGYLMMAISITFLYYLGKFLYENPKIAKLIYEYIFE